LNICAKEPLFWTDKLDLGAFLDPVIVFGLEGRLSLAFSSIDVVKDDGSKMRNLKRKLENL